MRTRFLLLLQTLLTIAPLRSNDLPVLAVTARSYNASTTVFGWFTLLLWIRLWHAGNLLSDRNTYKS
ncbi:MAG: hypothetical protein QOJ99_2515 [Bryobacterales bacterium]|jgi:hypothetical protein|nr:hypothetical protein [Bryobacterales bacterium]